jgi:LEA14-like dessication related protein
MIIAFLSNLFTALVENQLIIEIKEKAKMTLDLEVVLRFFKTIFKRKLDNPELTKFVFIIEPKEQEEDFSLDEIESEEDSVEEQNKKLFNNFKTYMETHLTRTERTLMASIKKMEIQISKIEKNVNASSIRFRQQNIEGDILNL